MSAAAHQPRPDFKKAESSRPPATPASFTVTRTILPDWTFGGGANTPEQPPPPPPPPHVSIDPYEPGRPPQFNYKLLISSIVPRPIAFLSTRSGRDGATNLAPFSYFNMVSHDPPLFVVGFSSPLASAKDSLRNLVDTGECVINIISEPFVEAANSTSIDAPYGTSEWPVSGLTAEECDVVGCPRVGEAVVSVEAKLDMVKEWESRVSGNKTGTMVVLEGVRFWVRQDALNEDRNMVDPAVLRPVARMGGITYARTMEAFELPRPRFEQDLGGHEGLERVKNRK
ncbi:FMN-binding split barrel [Metarhizium album ARSEF 1941]|uniref:FMN-binding split barrel n=1 Tax=Metarhizium album (strain ARSEF 1941) TaxID=1081103 RepID=A0A0B2X309_METAS|nr:FMN-binding split barrel [Metarhizium album ARSEF 1941]KHN99690.1 FMN-binding split barrel [Metarhizium album ARSEF 1941]